MKKPTIAPKKKAPNSDILEAMNQKYSNPASLQKKSLEALVARTNLKANKPTHQEAAQIKTFTMENSRECYSNLLSEEFTKKLGVLSQVRVAPEYSTVLLPSSVARNLYTSTREEEASVY